MPRRTATDVDVSVLSHIVDMSEEGGSADDKLRLMQQVREASPESAAQMDQCLLHEMARLSRAVSDARGHQRELRAVLDRVVHVHLKDIRRAKLASGHETGTPAGVPIGDGEVDIVGCLDLLKSKGYQGALSIEVEGKEALVKSKRYLEPLIA